MSGSGVVVVVWMERCRRQEGVAAAVVQNRESSERRARVYHQLPFIVRCAPLDQEKPSTPITVVSIVEQLLRLVVLHPPLFRLHSHPLCRPHLRLVSTAL
jgi:hypothetical protein